MPIFDSLKLISTPASLAAFTLPTVGTWLWIILCAVALIIVGVLGFVANRVLAKIIPPGNSVVSQAFHLAAFALIAAVSFGFGKLLQVELVWPAAVTIIVCGLIVYGWSDLVRTHWQRVWAISGVCVTESLRRKVLWLTPLAMIGIIVVSQFQVASDFQDAVRQITKFCLFASGMLVILTAVILAATNLPREIETRIIFTVVTKPTTRLEIAVGKVLGFARISGMMILIMGVFTLAYLQFRVRPMIADLKAEVAKLDPKSPVRATDEYYINSGLLGTRSLEWGSDVEILAEPPGKDEKWALGGVAQFILVPFALTSSEDPKNFGQKEILQAAYEQKIPVYITVKLDIKRHDPDDKERQEARDAKLEEPPKELPGEKPLPKFDVTPATTQPAEKRPLIPSVQVRYLDENHVPLIRMDEHNAGDEVTLKPTGEGAVFAGTLAVPTEVVSRMAEVGRFYTQITPRTPAMEFGVRGWAVSMSVPLQGMKPIEMAVSVADPSKPAESIFGAFPIREGIRLTPVRPWGNGPLAVFHFRDTKVEKGNNGKVGIQIAVNTERAGDFKDDPEHPLEYSSATLQVRNLQTGETSDEVAFSPETSRTEPVGIDAKYLAGGNFDVYLRGKTQGQNLGIRTDEKGAIALVTADRVFFFNLVKSLFILWLLSLLVVIIAIFCSTFVSWPIAVVLTMVILLAHWGVDQLGSALDRGASRSTVTTLGFRDPSSTQVLVTAMDRLSAGLKDLAACLPDVAAFPVMEDIELGVSIPPAKVFGALGQIFCFGLPMLVFSYTILRRTEVAP